MLIRSGVRVGAVAVRACMNMCGLLVLLPTVRQFVWQKYVDLILVSILSLRIRAFLFNI